MGSEVCIRDGYKNVSAFFVTYKRGRVFDLWSTCYAFGGLVAMPFAGWYVHRLTYDWHMAFLSSAGVVPAVAVPSFLLQRSRPQDVGLPPVEAGVTPPANAFRPSHSGALLKALRNPHVLVLGIVYFLLKPARYTILFWGPVVIYERMSEIGKVVSAVVPLAFEVARPAGPTLTGPALDKLFGARRMSACVLSLAALTLNLVPFVPMMQSGSLYLVVGLLFTMGVTLYGPGPMISGAAAIDFGTSEAAGTATDFVNGCGSVGAILGGLLPGYFDTLTAFFVFIITALLVSLLLVPFWNSQPDARCVEPKVHAGGPLLAAGKSR